MTKIKHMIDEICDEIEGAKGYAERYLEYRAEQDSTWAGRFKSMAEDELKHAGYLHELAVQEIQKLKQVYKPPEEMQETWDKAHAGYVEKAAWIRQMLQM